MTTHYEKIQALGNRMASNLETMGVSASFSDGGLTLTDKILEIQHFTDGLLLWADKDIIQTGDTVNFCALLLEDKKAVSGETIFFRGLETTQTLVANTETSVGNQYRFTNLPSSSSDWGNGKVYLNEEQTAYLHHNGDNIMVFANNRGYPISNNISIENGIITCYDSQTSSKYTFDISSTNTNKITSTISDVTIAETMQGTTGSNGVATVSYTGVGAGNSNVQAKTIDGSSQSEIFVITDAMFIDTGTIDKSSSWALNNISYSQSNNCITLSNSTGSNKLISAKVGGSSSGYIDSSKDYCVEVDIKNIDATAIRIYLDNSFVDVKNYVDTSNFTSIKIYTNRAENKLYYEINGTTSSKSLDTPIGNVSLRIANNESYQFKNYKLYLI